MGAHDDGFSFVIGERRRARRGGVGANIENGERVESSAVAEWTTWREASMLRGSRDGAGRAALRGDVARGVRCYGERGKEEHRS